MTWSFSWTFWDFAVWTNDCRVLALLRDAGVILPSLDLAPWDWTARDIDGRVAHEQHLCAMCPTPKQLSRQSFVISIETTHRLQPRWLDLCREHAHWLRGQLAESLLPTMS